MIFRGKQFLIVLTLTCGLGGRATAGDLESLDWLTGCWAGDDADTHYEECWLHPGGGIMLGLNRTVSATGVAFEFLRIGPNEGGIALFASPGGREPVPFPLSESAPGLAVFLNPEHDFPQRITYRLDGDTLRADVEALENGEWTGFALVWERSTLER